MKKILLKINAWYVSVRSRVQNTLTKIEENYNFPISHVFWHFVTALGVLAAVVGLVIVLYGISPTFKKGVDEPELLSQRDVTADQVGDCARQKKPVVKTQKRKVAKKVNNQIIEEEVEEVVEPPVISLANLQVALPDMKLSQKGRKLICEHSEGHYEYGDWGDWVYPSRCYEYGDVDTQKAKDVRSKLQRWFPYDSLSQQNTIDRVASHLMKYELSSRNEIYKISMQWLGRANNVGEVFDLWTSIDAVIGNVGSPASTVSPEKVFAQLDDFMSNNPNSGRTVLVKALEVVALASGSDRLQAFKISRAAYRSFSLNIEEWTKATDKFVAMKDLHVASDYLYNLECYYELYLSEAEERLAENDRRERQYRMDKAEAEAEYSARKAAKHASLPVGGIVIAIGFGVFILMAIILVLFSVQRTLVRMENVLKELKEKA